LFSLVLFYIKILKNPEKILIIIQRSNGDVLFILPLINALYEYYQQPTIDLLVNDDTLPLAKMLPHVNFIHQFSYQKKRDNRWQQERYLLKSIFKKYDLSINLTASDRSVFYALFAGKKSVSAIEINNKKSWWKKALLTQYYYFDSTKHILLNNLKPLNLLNIKHDNIQQSPNIVEKNIASVREKLNKAGVKNFIIFHPSAQYSYKIYPKHLRDKLLASLNTLDVPIIITGGNSQLDTEIKSTLPNADNIFNWIGETTLEEYFALSELSSAYIGMDTLNMHIAAGQNKRIFAIFGPTNLKMWSPWSNKSQKCASLDKPIQNYGNITIFQADMPCVACGKAGCDDKHGKSECLDHIDPKDIFNEVKEWYQNAKL
jgi:heptosyltransferase III